MPDTIRDGKGKGYLAEVDNKNRLHAYSIVEAEASYINRVEGEMYSGSWGSSGVAAATGGNYIFYLKNTAGDKDLVVVKLKHRTSGAAGSLSVELKVTGTPGGTLTTLTPSNRNAGSNNVAQCNYYSSTNITGLTAGRTVGSSYFDPTIEGAFKIQELCSGWILPPNGTLAIKANNATATHYGGISFYFRDSQ